MPLQMYAVAVVCTLCCTVNSMVKSIFNQRCHEFGLIFMLLFRPSSWPKHFWPGISQKSRVEHKNCEHGLAWYDMAINFGGNVLKTHGSLPSITVIWGLLDSLLRYDGFRAIRRWNLAARAPSWCWLNADWQGSVDLQMITDGLHLNVTLPNGHHEVLSVPQFFYSSGFEDCGPKSIWSKITENLSLIQIVFW